MYSGRRSRRHVRTSPTSPDGGSAQTRYATKRCWFGCVFANRHGGVVYLWVCARNGFDLAQFDAVAPDFHLGVQAPQKFDLAVFAVTRLVARAVEQGAGLGAEAVGDEFSLSMPVDRHSLAPHPCRRSAIHAARPRVRG